MSEMGRKADELVRSLASHMLASYQSTLVRFYDQFLSFGRSSPIAMGSALFQAIAAEALQSR
ncbi:hypothetical protein N9D37_01375 [Erythrobacter sp.]|nr:hypothetical protein [Erythrobacter sp.]